MFPHDILFAYIAACLVVVIAPGPDNILAISRGLSQGKAAATLSSIGAGLGIMCHTVAAALGLSLVIQASPVAFWAVKAVGGLYLLWLGYKALASRNLISFEPSAHQSLRKVFLTGWLSNVLNPKPGLFVLAFLPQFVSASRGPVAVQMLVYGAIFAVLTALIFTVLGSFAFKLSAWMRRHPRVGTGLNLGAGLTFIAAGLSVLALKQRT
ncbi:LysE family translocator [Variovorax sp. EL159]|uniref:LysE family translocator n=1 Tax=Variovorax sp. EL159 TaxID=1566270 RepID=UPI0008897541|nr:LysE family translocator [Variovorax sp. EL159]SCX46545.1 Threonine/homoserine/homoserine lactone efflux protein [Variovorax sp. EL159]